MVDDVVSGCINFNVGIMVDLGGELWKLAIELLFPLQHGFGVEGFGEGKTSCWHYPWPQDNGSHAHTFV